MTKSKKYKMRLLGYSLCAVGLSRMNDVFDYYYPGLKNINYLFGATVIWMFIGFWIMLAFQDKD